MRSPRTTRKSWSCAASKAYLRRRGLFLAGAVMCAGFGSVCRAANAPDWLATANRVALGDFGKGSAAVVVAQWQEFTVEASGKYLSVERTAIRVLNRRAAEPYLIARGQESNDSSVVSIRTWSISPAGKVTESQKKDIITVANYAEFALFSDSRMKAVRAPGVDQGAMVGLEVVREGRTLISGTRFTLDSDIPVLSSQLRVSVPSGSLRWFVNHPDGVEVVNQSATQATFQITSRPALPDEENAPPPSSLLTEVVINYDPRGSAAVQSWEEAGRSYHPLFSGAETPSSEIRDEVENLSHAGSDLASKVDALYTFVSRRIRYVAIEVGIGGYQPHPAPDVYKYMYGDCKDKATLLVTMLGHIGLRAFPALIGTRGSIEADSGMPTLATFNHMIVALPVTAELRPVVERFPAYDRQAQILWIDPTSETAPLGQLPEMDQGVFALISYADRGELRRVPEAPAEQNGVEVEATVRLQPGGGGSAEVEVKYLGASNARRHSLYRNRSETEIRRMFEERVARYATQTAFRGASVSGTEDNHRQVIEKYSFSGNFASGFAGDSWFFQPLFLSGMAVPEVNSRPRLLPLDIGTPYRISEKYRLELPAGLGIEAVPEETLIESEFGTLRVKYSLNGSVLTATQTLSFSVSRIPAEKYASFREFVNSSLRVQRQRLQVTKSAI